MSLKPLTLCAVKFGDRLANKFNNSHQICPLDPNVLLDEAWQAGVKSGRRRGQRGGAYNKIGEAQIQHAQINKMFSEKINSKFGLLGQMQTGKQKTEMALTYMNLIAINLKEKSKSTHVTNLVCCMCARKWVCESQSKILKQILALACLIETAVVETSSFILSAVALQKKTICWFIPITETMKFCRKCQFHFRKEQTKMYYAAIQCRIFQNRAEFMWLPFKTLAY